MVLPANIGPTMTWISPEAAVDDIDMGRQKQRDFDSRQEEEEDDGDEGGEEAKGLARKRRRETKSGAEKR